MKSSEELKNKIEKATSLIKIGSTYVHSKSQNEYIVKDLVIIESSEEVGVVYEANYKELKEVKFIRPISEFLEQVNLNGKMVQRFVKKP